MGRQHLLDVYECTSTPNCLGCFNQEEAAPAEAPPDDPPAERPGERAPVEAEPERRLVAATWGVPRARDGERVTLHAVALNIPDGTSATLRIFESDRETSDDFVEELTAEVQGGAIESEWIYEYEEDDEAGPADFDRYRLPEFYFVVSAAGLEARSGLLAFRADVEHQLLYPDETPADDCAYVLVLPDGSTRQGRADAEGWVREAEVPPGTYRIVPGS